MIPVELLFGLVALATLVLPVLAGAVYIQATKSRRPRKAATASTFLLAAVSMLVIPVIGLVIEVFGIAVAVASLFAAPFTIGATLLVFLLVLVGIVLEFVSIVLAWIKLGTVMAHALAGTISDGKAGLLIGSSYFFALLGFIGVGVFGEMVELSEVSDIADLDGLSDLGSVSGLGDIEVAELDADGFGPADSTYGDPSVVDGDPRSSHYVEGYERADGTSISGHWKGKRG